MWAEEMFPVAELARDLVGWLYQPDGERGDFEFDSMSYAELGAVRITGTLEGWRVGSVFAPDTWTAPVAWDVLVTEVGQFVGALREDVAAIGIEPSFISDL